MTDTSPVREPDLVYMQRRIRERKTEQDDLLTLFPWHAGMCASCDGYGRYWPPEDDRVRGVFCVKQGSPDCNMGQVGEVQRSLAEWFDRAGLPGVYREAPGPLTEDTLGNIQEYVDNFEARASAGRALVILGEPGVGKSRILGYFVRLSYALRPRVSCYYRDHGELLAELEANDSALRRFSDCEVLLIDDFGTGNETPERATLFGRLVERRYSARAWRATVVASNAVFADLDRPEWRRWVQRWLEHAAGEEPRGDIAPIESASRRAGP